MLLVTDLIASGNGIQTHSLSCPQLIKHHFRFFFFLKIYLFWSLLSRGKMVQCNRTGQLLLLISFFLSLPPFLKFNFDKWSIQKSCGNIIPKCTNIFYLDSPCIFCYLLFLIEIFRFIAHSSFYYNFICYVLYLLVIIVWISYYYDGCKMAII